MITVGPMQLNQPQAADPMEPFFLGTQSGGGYWTDVSRLSAHDHSGGLMGATVAVDIPDGSITAADLAPSVLAPYALVDGSKPFTGQVVMGADAVVRDALYFGEQGSALAPDAHLRRDGPGWLSAPARLDLAAPSGNVHLTWGGGAGQLQLYGFDARVQAATGQLQLQSVAGTPLINLLNRTAVHDVLAFGAAGAADGGDVTLSRTSATQVTASGALGWEAGAGLLTKNGLNGRVYAPAGDLELHTSGQNVIPPADAFINLGKPSFRWATVYASAGAINTSSATTKTDVTPLDPLACYQAAKAVAWYAFVYRPPVYREPEPSPETAYDAGDDNATKAAKKALRDEAEARSQGAYARMLAETAPARHQRGFVFPDGADAKDDLGGALPPVPELFGLADRESTTPQADLATLGCALQEVIRRLEALEALEAPAA